MKPPLLIHCHMPKTAGSALNRTVLRPRHRPEVTMMAYGVSFERRKRFPFDEATPPEGIELLSGHIPFGYGAGFDATPLYVSILRDPVDRMLSFLNFAAVAARHGSRRQFDEDMQTVARTDPERFVRMMLGSDLVRLRQTNVMVRLASGMPRLSKKRPGRWRLEQARLNARRDNYLLGVQEDFDAFADYLTTRLEDLKIGTANAATDLRQGPKAEKRFEKVISRSDMPPALIEAVREANSLDQRLYDLVAERSLARAKAA